VAQPCSKCQAPGSHLFDMVRATCSSYFTFGRVRSANVWATRIPGVTLLICYALWLAHGCSPFMPFISDLGLDGEMHVMFCGGLVLTATCLAATHLDALYVRWCLIQQTTNRKYMHALNGIAGVAGLAIVLGVGCIGFFPWDRALKSHIMCANVIFYGGAGWACCNLVWQRSMLKLNRRQKYLQFALVLLSLLSLGMMILYLSRAFKSQSQSVSMLKEAKNDFTRYCRSKEYDALSIAAVFEWLLIASLVGSVTTLQADFDSHFGSFINYVTVDGIPHFTVIGK